MLKFNIIIPMDMSNDADRDISAWDDDTVSEDSSVLSVTRQLSSISLLSQSDVDPTDENLYFLVPALVDLDEDPVIPQVAPSRHIKLERTFELENFLPPGLLQRIMSRTYFRYGNKVNQTAHNGRHFMSYQKSERNCWKDAFLQSFTSKRDYGEISVWVWLEKESSKTCEHPPAPAHSNGANYEAKRRQKSSPKVEIQGTIHISVFGHIFACQEILKKLNFYADIVSDVLWNFRSLCHVKEAFICPICLMEERRLDCGKFSREDLSEISSDLITISKGKERYLRTHAKDSTIDSTFEWAKSCQRRCPRQGCIVSPEYLVTIPLNLYESNIVSPLDQAQSTISFLMEEIVRLSSMPSSTIVNSVCKVGVGCCKIEKYKKFRLGEISRLDDIYFPPNRENMATGAVIDISHGFETLEQCGFVDLCDENVFVVSCEHFISDIVTKECRISVPLGMVPIYLIGSELLNVIF